jgi:outer membrane protein
VIEDSVHRHKSAAIAVATGLLSLAVAAPASAETITQALASAYSSNPTINSARAQTRADDEGVSIARGGLTPVITLFNTTTESHTNQVLSTSSEKTTGTNVVGVQITQNLFTGFRVKNAVKQAEVGVLASREVLRNTVENVLFDAAQSYMDVLRDGAILEIRRRNVLFLEEQVRAANERFNVGENTRTDVAQARAALATARAAVSLAESNLATSRATYRQIIGHDPDGLSETFPYSRLVPSNLTQAVSVGLDDHPLILAAIHQADAQAFKVKQAESELLPQVSVQGTVQHNETLTGYPDNYDPNSATISAQVSIPLYAGAAAYGTIRQSKELYGQRKIDIDVARDQVRAAVVTAWAQLNAAAEAISAATEGVSAAEIALSGVQEEQKVGQRTTLDVLNQQQTLLSARETLIGAQHDRIVASFSLLSAMGRLTAEGLRLPTPAYDPKEHYRAVRGLLIGVSTPDGR